MRYKRLLLLLGLSCLLLASAIGVSAAPKQSARASLAPIGAATAQGCALLQAGPVTWLTLDDQGQIDQRVASYPSGTTEIVPSFEYACVPKNTTIVTVFTFEGDPVLSDKEALRISNQAGVYSYPLSADDGAPLNQGEWKVSFYSDKLLLGSSVVRVGGDPGSNGVAVRGTVRDGNTRNAIRGAFVAVLKPGISVKTFLDGGKQSDILASGTSDGLGQFSLNRPLMRDISYGLLIVARGYRPIIRDDLRLGASDPDPLQMDILIMK